ncbi:uncharacterized protein LOC106159097 isoform X2 [Lingula anatina]|uniref:HECT-type E3 ubiquitin transferase n=1 Tax=Lingula anatina TaxID=7574 RepID=A0A1S3I069_LINAN|nr:uncharacterized protein LOC106159097 isoform X2 [Lingula anatina]|eukprot:XP_013390744.1 uncharacterized protein LOC106159097 isoform X2 [Lingula anatina]
MDNDVHIQVESEGRAFMIPVPPEGFTLTDLGQVFPGATGLQYKDDDGSPPTLVLKREDTFRTPLMGWNVQGRTYQVIKETSLDVFAGFRAEREQNRRTFFRTERRPALPGTEAGPSSRPAFSTKSVTLAVGIGEKTGGFFVPISARNKRKVGGTVNITVEAATANAGEITSKALQKFEETNCRFDKNEKWILAYPDGSQVVDLPDKSAPFNLKAYKEYLSMEYRRIRLYLTVKDVPSSSSSSSSSSSPSNSSSNSSSSSSSEEEDATQVHSEEADNIGNEDDVETGTPTVTFRNTSEDVMADRDLYFHSDDSSSANLTVTQSLSIPSGVMEIEEKIDSTIGKIVQRTCQLLEDEVNPEKILRVYSSEYLEGRNMDTVEIDTDETTTYERTELFISRFTVWEDALEQLLSIDNLRYPLYVSFHGEEAIDYGGPRREFLQIMVTETKNRLFREENGVVTLLEDDFLCASQQYFLGGLICGLSMLQGGPCPTFVEYILDKESKHHKQFMSGLRRVGIIQLMEKLPTLRMIFKESNASLTFPKIQRLLKAEFSAPQSSRRREEEHVYGQFLRYLREVAGRRKSVTLGHILAFCTGAREIPSLGFPSDITLTFSIGTESMLPTASTCIMQMNLKIPALGVERPPQEFIYNLWDLAFSNTFFGLC